MSMFTVTVGDRPMVAFTSVMSGWNPTNADVLRNRAKLVSDHFVQVPITDAPLFGKLVETILEGARSSLEAGNSASADPIKKSADLVFAIAEKFYLTADTLQALAGFNIERINPSQYGTLTGRETPPDAAAGEEKAKADAATPAPAKVEKTQVVPGAVDFEQFMSTFAGLQRLRSSPNFTLAVPMSSLKIAKALGQMQLENAGRPLSAQEKLDKLISSGSNGAAVFARVRLALYSLRLACSCHLMAPSLGISAAARGEDANQAAVSALRKVAGLATWWALLPRILKLCYYRALLRSPLVQEALLWNQEPSRVDALVVKADRLLSTLDLLGIEKQLAAIWSKPRRCNYQGVSADEHLLPDDIATSTIANAVKLPDVQKIGRGSYPKQVNLDYTGVDNQLTRFLLPNDYAAAGAWRQTFGKTSLAIFQALSTLVSEVSSLQSPGAFPLARFQQFPLESGMLVRHLVGPDDYAGLSPTTSDSGDHSPLILGTGEASTEPPNDAGALLDRPIVPATIGPFTAAQVAVHAAIYASGLADRIKLRMGITGLPKVFIPVRIADAHASWFAEADFGPIKNLFPRCLSYHMGLPVYQKLDRESLARMSSSALETNATALAAAIQASLTTELGLQALADKVSGIGIIIQGKEVVQNKKAERQPLTLDDVTSWIDGTDAIETKPAQGSLSVRYGVNPIEVEHRKQAFGWKGKLESAITVLDEAKIYGFLAFAAIPAPPRLDAQTLKLVTSPSFAKGKVPGMPEGWMPVDARDEGDSKLGPCVWKDDEAIEWLPNSGFVMLPEWASPTTSWISLEAGYRMQSPFVLLLDDSSASGMRLTGAGPNDVLLMNDGSALPRLSPWSLPVKFVDSPKAPDPQALVLSGLIMSDVRTVVP